MILTKKQIYIASILSLFILSIIVIWWFFFSSFSNRGDGTYIYIDNDDTKDTVFYKMKEIGKPSQMAGVKIASFLLNYNSHIHSGRYEVGNQLSSLQIVRNLRNGHQSPVELTIPIVHTVNELAAFFSKVLQPNSVDFERIFTDSATLAKLNVNIYTVPTLFIPNTYEVYWNISPQKLLERMKKERDIFWTTKRIAQAKQISLTPEEVYTLASIVEQESANEQERPMIAGMYLNRLRIGMKLQADPTVKFALNNFKLQRIMHNHLTTQSPYNTYLYEGLPPGPICIPSLNAIESVLNYTPHNYIYMCAKEDFSGTHNFAATYEEHLANAKKYSQALDKRNIH